MFKLPSTQSQNMTLSESMRVFYGKCQHNADDIAVIGRIVSYDRSSELSGKEAALIVVEDNSGIPDDLKAVGIIALCHNSITSHCPVISLSHLPKDCEGKIALLDPAAGALFVSPDITTVNQYKSVIGCPIRKKAPLRLPCGKAIRILSVPRGIWEVPREGDGYLIDIEDMIFTGEDLEERLYEAYRDSAEKSVGVSIIAKINSVEYRYEQIRALMRGGVYGSFSVLFGGILTISDADKALTYLRRAYCELELEGREFNGYLPRGLYIDTPYLLSISEEIRGFDFFVYDTEKILRLMTGRDNAISAPPLLDLCYIIGEILSKRTDLEHSVILGENTIISQVCGILTRYGIDKYFTATDTIPRLEEALRQGLIYNDKNVNKK